MEDAYWYRAHDRMTSRKPKARTNARAIILHVRYNTQHSRFNFPALHATNSKTSPQTSKDENARAQNTYATSGLSAIGFGNSEMEKKRQRVGYKTGPIVFS